MKSRHSCWGGATDVYSIIVLYTSAPVIIAATEVVVITVALGITAEMPTTKLRICAADREDPKPQPHHPTLALRMKPSIHFLCIWTLNSLCSLDWQLKVRQWVAWYSLKGAQVRLAMKKPGFRV